MPTPQKRDLPYTIYLCIINLKIMNRQVAIPIKNERLCKYFGECDYYEIFETDGINTIKKIFKTPVVQNINEMPTWLEKKGVTDVIAYRVEKEIIFDFALKRINLFIGIPQKLPELLFEDYKNGRLRSDENIIAEII